MNRSIDTRQNLRLALLAIFLPALALGFPRAVTTLDGSTIQAALDACPPAHCVVNLEAEEYLLTAPLQVHTHQVSLLGKGENVTKLKRAFSGTGYDGAMIRTGQAGQPDSFVYGFEMANLTVDGNLTGASADYEVWFTGHYASIHSVTFEECHTVCLYLHGGRSLRLHDTLFTKTGSMHVYAAQKVNGLSGALNITASQFHMEPRTTQRGVVLNEIDDVSIVGSQFYSGGRQVEVGNAVVVVITGNVFYDGGYLSESILIDGRNQPFGGLTGAREVVVSGNVITSGGPPLGLRGIRVTNGAYGVTIGTNTIWSYQETCLLIEPGANVQVGTHSTGACTA